MGIKKSKGKKFYLYKPLFETGLGLYLETILSYRLAQNLIRSASSSSTTLLFIAHFYLNSQKSYKHITDSRSYSRKFPGFFSVLRLRDRPHKLYIIL